jgi:ABC-type phosphate/phosphonate transport system substrate-binding protein
LVVAGVLLGGSFLFAENGETPRRSGQPTVVRFATTPDFLGSVNTTDAMAAYETYTNGIVDRWELNARAEAHLYDDVPTIREALSYEEVDVVGLLTEHYLELEGDGLLDVVFTGEIQGETTQEFLIVTRTDGARHLNGLDGRDLLVLSGSKMGMSGVWLENLVLKEGMNSAERFFGSVTVSPRPSQVVLPVFFGTADACLVNRQSLDTMIELNPQLASRLQVIEASPPIVPHVTCMRRGFTGAFRERAEEAFRDAHLDPDGRQILTLFRFDRAVPCSPRDLESARRLVRRVETATRYIAPRSSSMVGASIGRVQRSANTGGSAGPSQGLMGEEGTRPGWNRIARDDPP